MATTNNNNLNLVSMTDNANIVTTLNGNWNIIDGGLNPFFVATASGSVANTYIINTGLSKTSLNNGYSFRVAIPSASTGAVSIIIDSLSAIAVKNSNGNAVTNFKQNGIYNLTYYNGNFILASGSIDTVSFTSDKLLSGNTANDSNGNSVSGAMPNNGALSATLGINASYTIPPGYTSGGTVSQNIPTLSATTYTPSTSDQAIASGKYISGTQTIKGDANLISKNILNSISLFGVVGNVIPSKYQFTTGTTKSFSGTVTAEMCNRYINIKSSIGFTPKLIIGSIQKYVDSINLTTKYFIHIYMDNQYFAVYSAQTTGMGVEQSTTQLAVSALDKLMVATEYSSSNPLQTATWAAYTW